MTNWTFEFRHPAVVMFVLLLLWTTGFADTTAISPGGAERFVTVHSPCPTFSWTFEPGASYELEIYRVGAEGPEDDDPVLRQSLPRGATSWTPSEAECLAAGRRYAWSVRTVFGDSTHSLPEDWSEALLFEVPEMAVTVEQYRALRQELDVLRRSAAAAEPTGQDLPGFPSPTVASGSTAGEGMAKAAESGGRQTGRLSSASTGIPAGAGNPPPTGGMALFVESDDPDGAAAAFVSDVGGHLISGQAQDVEVFSVDAGGQVTATAYAGDGSGLSNVLAAGQSCPLGTTVRGIGEDGSLLCGPVGRFPVASGAAIAIGADGNPVMVLVDNDASDLLVIKCNDPICAGGDETVTAADLNVNWIASGGASIAMGSDGNPDIAYFEDFGGAPGSLRFLDCNDPACASRTIRFIYSATAIAGAPSLAVGSDGLPVMSFYDADNGNLMVAKCNDAACAGANETITTVDGSTDDVGQGSSLALDSSNRPRIAYRNVTTDEILIVSCNDPACAPGSDIISVLQEGDTDPGLLIGSNGNAMVISGNSSFGGVSIARCTNIFCSEVISPHEYELLFDGVDDVEFTAMTLGAGGIPVVFFGIGGVWVGICEDPLCDGGLESLSGPFGDMPLSVKGGSSIEISSIGNPLLMTGIQLWACADPQCFL